jgi:phenylpyruvate tautomerase PptA (4-oxalocrotonate tautomerase family)
MPLINMYTSAPPPATGDARELLGALSATLARELGKPEAYVMTCLVPRAAMTFAGTEGPACYAELKNIGELSAEKAARLSAVLCDMLSRGLDVPRDLIYIELASVEAHLWGWNGETFA